MSLQQSTRLSAVFLFAVGSLGFGLQPALADSEIWNGPPITFTRPAAVDGTLAENQDRITDKVWIARQGTRGIYNAAAESSYSNNLSPAGTLWALGTTDDLGSLTFESWEEMIRNSSISTPPNLPGNDLVMYLLDDDIYIDVRFLEDGWGVGFGGGGSFSYQRSTAIPEPSTIVLGLLAAAGCYAYRRRARA